MSKKLTVSIVAYNNYDDIYKAIDSIEKYTNNEISKTIYIIDNGVLVTNKDKVDEFKSYIERYEDVLYVTPGSNVGFGKGHNYIIDKIDSDYYAIVNPDIELVEDAFGPLLEYMDNNEDVGMTIPLITDEKGNRLDVYRKEVTVCDLFIRMFCKKLFPKRVAAHTLSDMDYSKHFQVPFGQGSFLVIRTDLFKQLNGFDDRFFMYMEDADLCKRVNQKSKLMYVPNARVIHKWEKGSHKNKTLFKYHIQSMIKYFKKWGWK